MAIVNDNIVDLNIKGIEKTKIRINGRDDSILELNLSDINIVTRLQEGYAKLDKLFNYMKELDIKEDNFSTSLHDIDTQMRDAIDYIFDAPVSEVCCRQGTMFDLTDGEYRFEHIVNTLLNLYGTNIANEFEQMKKRIKKHTDTYIPQDHKVKTKKEKSSK